MRLNVDERVTYVKAIAAVQRDLAFAKTGQMNDAHIFKNGRAIIEPVIRMDFTARLAVRINRRAEPPRKITGSALVIFVGEDDAGGPKMADEFLQRLMRKRQWVHENQPSIIHHKRAAAEVGFHRRIVALPEKQAVANGLKFFNRAHGVVQTKTRRQ